MTSFERWLTPFFVDFSYPLMLINPPTKCHVTVAAQLRVWLSGAQSLAHLLRAWGSMVRSIWEANMGVGKNPKTSPQLLPAHSVSLPSTHTLLRTNLSPRSHTHTWTRGINHRRRRSDAEGTFSFFLFIKSFHIRGDTRLMLRLTACCVLSQ